MLSKISRGFSLGLAIYLAYDFLPNNSTMPEPEPRASVMKKQRRNLEAPAPSGAVPNVTSTKCKIDS